MFNCCCCRLGGLGGPGPGYPMMLGYPMMAPPQLAQVGPLLMPGTGSIRSVQSVPMLNHHTWDGEPCPVHHGHHHGHGPMVPLAALYGECNNESNLSVDCPRVFRNARLRPLHVTGLLRAPLSDIRGHHSPPGPQCGRALPAWRPRPSPRPPPARPPSLPRGTRPPHGAGQEVPARQHGQPRPLPGRAPRPQARHGRERGAQQTAHERTEESVASSQQGREEERTRMLFWAFCCDVDHTRDCNIRSVAWYCAQVHRVLGISVVFQLCL